MIRAALALATLCLAGPALAQSFNLGGPPPTAEYSADQLMETEHGRIPSKVWHAKDKERREMEMGGHKTTTIMRLDKKVTWTLMPEQQMYMETAFGEAPKGPGAQAEVPAYDVEQTPAGEEVVNGITCKKTKVIMTDRKSGAKLGGFFWTSPENILVKADAVAKNEGQKTRFKLELTNLKVGPQPEELFEVPAGYSKFEMPGMGDAMKGMMKGMMKGGRP
jgi:hypothetical protein